MLKSVDHDSMSGEHVGTTLGLIITSGKSEFGHWQPLKIRDLESCENSQGEKDLGTFSFGYIAYGRRQDTA
jgi:hypothetical protein